jgi:deoxyribonuclease-4
MWRARSGRLQGSSRQARTAPREGERKRSGREADAFRDLRAIRIRASDSGLAPKRLYDGPVSSRIRLGPARLPSRESPEAAVELILERGYSACEIDFESGFWMDYPFAERLGELARENDIALSVHAPLFGFMGHVEPSGRKFSSAVGALDRSAGIASASGAEVVVFHPGFLLERTREDAIAAVVEQLGTLRERLEQKERAVSFGVEVMGRVRDLGSLDDVLEISRRTRWVRPVLDFAHMHATSDGAYLDVDPFAVALAAVDEVLEEGIPFHIHFSDIAYANRNETKHLPYGEGTLRAEPLRDALARFERPATVISESPDEASSQAIRAVLEGGGDSSASRTS